MIQSQHSRPNHLQRINKFIYMLFCWSGQRRGWICSVGSHKPFNFYEASNSCSLCKLKCKSMLWKTASPSVEFSCTNLHQFVLKLTLHSIQLCQKCQFKSLWGAPEWPTMSSALGHILQIIVSRVFGFTENTENHLVMNHSIRWCYATMLYFWINLNL